MGIYEPIETGSRSQRTFTFAARMLVRAQARRPAADRARPHALYGLVVLYSASGQSLATRRRAPACASALGVGRHAACSRRSIRNSCGALRRWLYAVGIVLLLVVDGIGHIGKGAQRWLDLGFIRFQPSEIMKLAVPMTVRVVPARAAAAAELSIAAGAGRDHPAARRRSSPSSPISAPAR